MVLVWVESEEEPDQPANPVTTCSDECRANIWKTGPGRLV